MKKTDFILLFSVIALAALLWGVFYLVTDRDGSVAVICVDGEEYERLPLDKDTTLTVSTEYGTNTVVVSNGEVFVKDADCPDKICVKTGKATDTRTVVCLPHKLTVTVEVED